ncbi:NAD(P)/FAD-dependent oxidoreductase, partial [Haliangium sp.]|uniref:NAD(P)/FAD-dependent oxidoreductase n=1 Tax=Haliangium sp. TaxID=2663208 RepID=UPI003D142127
MARAKVRFARPADEPVPERAELVIIGAGVMGLAIAYHLARRGLTDQVILEASYLASGASGRNGGGVRQQWSTELNIRLMQASVERCRRFAKELGVNIWFRQGGYLFLARTEAEIARLEQNVALQQKHGLPTRMLDAAEVSDVVPEIDTDGILGAAYNPTDGIVFPWPFIWGFGQRAVSLGAKLYTHTPVRAIDRLSEGGFRVHTERGAVIARRVVNAAGAWSGDIAAMVGVDLPTYPVRHEICSSEPLKPFLGPMVSELSTGLYVSQSMRGEVIGGVSMHDEGPTISMGSRLRFLTHYASRLTRLMPVLGNIKVLRQWAGPYDMSPDGNPILGEPPGVPDFFLACGFVGHGFMMAPIVGDLYAAWLAGGERHELFEQCLLARFEDGASGLAKEDFN